MAKFDLGANFTVNSQQFRAGRYELVRAERWSQGEVMAWVRHQGPQGGPLQEVEVFRADGSPTAFGEALQPQVQKVIIHWATTYREE